MDQVGGILWDVTKCLCGCIKKEADYVFHLEENLQSLKEKWEMLENMKKDVETQLEEEVENPREMQRSHRVNGWLKKVEGIQKAIKNIQDQGTQEIENKCLGKSCPKNCKSSYKLGKNVAKMLKNADALTTEGQQTFGKDSQIAHKVRPKAIKLPQDETVGLDLMFDKVWNSIEEENVSVIGIYGMAGVGKTTLLKKINNEFGERRSDLFVMWVVVSKEPNLDSIMDNIRKLVGIGEDTWKSCSNLDEKAARIYAVLEQKKFVLLLDDIWEPLNLGKIGIPRPKEKDTNFKSKVLFTTRLKDVCAKMQAQRTFDVQILREDDALELFQRKVGEETLNLNNEIRKLAKEMAAACKGLPLALVVVGSAMAGVNSVDAWKHSKEDLTSSSWTGPDLETKVFSILKFNYDRLPDEIHKNCFLYCALYPEDYEIWVSDLIDKWIGEGFLVKDMTKSIHDMRNEGKSVITKLKLCCLLESVEDDVFEYCSVKMHDMIRDMALWLACDQGKKVKKVLVQGDARAESHDDVEKWKVVERISIIGGKEWHVPSVGCPNLKTLLLRPCNIEGLENIKHMSRLKCLELHGPSWVVPGEIVSDLVLLEYLSLDLDASELPKVFTNLKNVKLLALYVKRGMLVSTPLEVISSVQQLSVLKIAYVPYLKVNGKEEREFLEMVESLPKLEELNIDIVTEDGLNKILASAKLQRCISVLRSHLTKIEMPLLDLLSKMKNLRQFSTFFLFEVEDSSVFDTHCSVCDTYCLTMLQSVSIFHCPTIRHVTWLQYAPFLQVLCIGDCSLMKEVIEEEGRKDEKGIENVQDDSIFSSLVTLELRLLPNLKSIHKSVLPFPSLRSIEIASCPNLKKLPFDSHSAKLKFRHIYGTQDWWSNLEWDDPAAKHKFQSKFNSNTVFPEFVAHRGAESTNFSIIPHTFALDSLRLLRKTQSERLRVHREVMA